MDRLHYSRETEVIDLNGASNNNEGEQSGKPFTPTSLHSRETKGIDLISSEQDIIPVTMKGLVINKVQLKVPFYTDGQYCLKRMSLGVHGHISAMLRLQVKAMKRNLSVDL